MRASYTLSESRGLIPNYHSNFQNNGLFTTRRGTDPNDWLNADQILQTQTPDHLGQVPTEDLPVRDRGLLAAAVAALVHGDHVALAQVRHHRVPAARMKARGVDEQQRRGLPAPRLAPLEVRELHPVRVDPMLRGVHAAPRPRSATARRLGRNLPNS